MFFSEQITSSYSQQALCSYFENVKIVTTQSKKKCAKYRGTDLCPLVKNQCCLLGWNKMTMVIYECIVELVCGEFKPEERTES